MLLRNDFSSVLPLQKGRKVAVLGPHATARKLLVQPYPSMVSHFPAEMIWCPDNTTDCIPSPFESITKINQINQMGGWTKTLPGCDTFDSSQAGFAAALALAQAADYVVLGLGISDWYVQKQPLLDLRVLCYDRLLVNTAVPTRRLLRTPATSTN